MDFVRKFKSFCFREQLILICEMDESMLNISEISVNIYFSGHNRQTNTKTRIINGLCENSFICWKWSKGPRRGGEVKGPQRGRGGGKGPRVGGGGVVNWKIFSQEINTEAASAFLHHPWEVTLSNKHRELNTLTRENDARLDQHVVKWTYNQRNPGGPPEIFIS